MTLTLKGLTGNYFSLQPNEEGLYDLLGSDASVSLEIASALDEDAQGAGGTAYALCLGMEIDEADPSKTVIAIGGMFEFADYFGMVLPPIYTEYTGFGQGNVAVLDQFLAANA